MFIVMFRPAGRCVAVQRTNSSSNHGCTYPKP